MKRTGDLTYQLLGQHLILTPEKAVYWVEQKTLILSDLHLGKSGHFRKHGVAIPETVNHENLERLNVLIETFKTDVIIFAGDLFHSDKNSEWNVFKEWRTERAEIDMHLAIGNHDFHPINEYEELGLNSALEICSQPFLFSHDPDRITDSEYYVISGHIHPSVRLTGKGRQSTRLPCYFFGSKGALLPAFGSMTGTHTIKPAVNETVFGIIENEVHLIS